MVCNCAHPLGILLIETVFHIDLFLACLEAFLDQHDNRRRAPLMPSLAVSNGVDGFDGWSHAGKGMQEYKANVTPEVRWSVMVMEE